MMRHDNQGSEGNESRETHSRGDERGRWERREERIAGERREEEKERREEGAKRRGETRGDAGREERSA